MNYQRKRVAKRLASGLLAGALALGGLAISGGTASAAATVTEDTRIAGADRYATANAVALAMVGTRSVATNNGIEAVVIASGENFPDGLAASALAGAIDAAQGGSPMLLTPADALPASVIGTITTLRVANTGLTNAVIVGGTSSVSANVQAQLTALGLTVTRIAGDDRYATANLVAAAVVANNGGAIGTFGGYRTAFLANGNNFPDALSASSWAFRNRHPLFLTNGSSLTAATKAAMTLAGVQQVVILGGTSAVSAEAATEVAGVPGVITSVRVAGADRYATATALATTLATVDADYRTRAMLVSGTNFPDALAAAQLAGQADSYAIVPVTSPLPAAVSTWLTANQATITNIRAIGGVAAVPADVVTAVKAGATISKLTATITALDGGTTAAVTFSAAAPTNAGDAANYTVVSALGVVKPATAAYSAPTLTTPATVVLTLTGAGPLGVLMPGDVVSVVAGNTITNAAGVGVAPASATVVADTSVPTAQITAFPGAASATGKVWVTFSANTKLSTVDVTGDSEDFVVTKGSGAIGATPAVITGCARVGTTYTYTCNLTAAAALVAGDTVTLKANAIDSIASTAVKNAATSAVVAADAVAPVLQSVRYSQAATGGAQAARTDVGATSAGKLTITARAGTAAAGRAGNAWSVVTTVLTGAETAATVSVDAAAKTVTVGAKATFLSENVAATLNSDAAFSALFIASTPTAGALTGFAGATAALTGGLDLLTLTLTFSEPLSAAAIGNFTISNTEITGQANPTLVAAAATDAGRLTGVLTVTVQTSGAPLAGVSTVTAAAAILDLNGNALVTSGTSHIVAMTPA